MAYSQCMENAARRHFKAAEHLYHETDRMDVAGYLYGISAECAIKEIMARSGIRPLDDYRRRDCPFYAHFPVLKTLLRNRICGRNSALLQRVIDTRFMQEWDITMRYAQAIEIKHHNVDLWREQAKQFITAMNGA